MTHFENEIKLIKNPEYKAKTQRLVDMINEKFYDVAASSTGKYHPDYAQGIAGLYRHTCAAVAIAYSLFEIPPYCGFSDDEKDTIIAALIMHDSCKDGEDWQSQWTVFDHPVQAAKFVLKILGEDDEFANNVAVLIVSHMGKWNTKGIQKLPYPETEYQKFVHMCDYLASRKFLEVNFNHLPYPIN